MSELVLGTVNFGMPYGPNKYQVPKEEIKRILSIAEKHDLMLDTALAYGSAQDSIKDYNNNILTKLSPFCQNVYADIRKNIIQLGRYPLYGVLIHSEAQLYDLETLSKLQSSKNIGMVESIGISDYDYEIAMVKNIGISVYDYEIAMTAAKMNFDFIQIPFSIFDNVLYFTNFFKDAKENGVKIFARSAFLQGFLINPPENKDYWLNYLKNIEFLDEICKKYQFSRREIALLFVKSFPEIDYIVIGVDSVQQLEENLETFNTKKLPKETKKELLETFSGRDYQIPSLWKGGN